MDEVHYLADRFRGAVWEEVIIHLPGRRPRRLALGHGQQRRGVRRLARHRPGRHRGGRRASTGRCRCGSTSWWASGCTTCSPTTTPTTRGAGDVPGLAGSTPSCCGSPADESRVVRGQRGPRDAGRRAACPAGRRPSRADVVGQLDRAGLLPAITFIFSRAGCDAAVQQCLRWGVRLTTPEERDEIRRVVDVRCADIPDEDLGVLGYWEWLEGLERGLAAHHAGLLPTFKEVVEELFSRGLVKAVFATETLALGVNMPARSVVLEKLVEVERRDARRHHAGGVHPAHRPRRPARDRRRGARRRPLAAGPRPGGGRRARLDPHLPAALELPPDVQHGRQPRRPGRPRAGPGDPRDVVRAVPGRPRRGRPGPAGAPPGGGARRLRRGDARATSATSREYAALRRRIADREAELSRRSDRDHRAAALASLEKLRRGDVVRVPGRAPGGLGGRRRPGDARRRRRAAADRADRRPADPPALAAGGARAAGAVDPGRRAEDVQLAQPRGRGATSPRPCGTRWGRRWTTTCARTAAARSRRTTRSSPTCAAGCGPTPATAARTARSTPGGPSAGGGCSARPSSSPAGSRGGPTRSRGCSTGSATCSPSGATSPATR